MYSLRLAALAALLTAPLPALAEQLINPTPKDCCGCIDISIASKKTCKGPGQGLPMAVRAPDGNFTLRGVQVKVREGLACGEVNIVKIELIPVDAFGPIQPVLVYANGAGTKQYPPADHPELSTVPIPGINEFSDDSINWRFVVTCSGFNQVTEGGSPETGSCTIPFTLGNPGCASCDGQPCAPTVSLSGTGTGTAQLDCNMSLGSGDAGDGPGTLRLHAPGLTYPGPAGLVAYVPSSFTVYRDENDVITKIATPTADIAVAIVDSNSFTLTYTHATIGEPNASTILGVAGSIFRVTTISTVTEGGSTWLRVASTFEDSSTTIHQAKLAAGIYTLQSGTFAGKVVANFIPLRTEALSISSGTTGGMATETHRHTISEAGQDISVTDTTYADHPEIGWQKISEVIDPGVSPHANLTSGWSYHSGTPGVTLGAGTLHEHTRYDGHHEVHTYSSSGNTITHTTTEPFAAAAQGTANGLTITRAWSSNTLTTTRTVNLKTLSKESVEYTLPTTITNQPDKHGPRFCPATTGFSIKSTVWATGQDPLTTIRYYNGFGNYFGGRSSSTTHPDGTVTTYTSNYSTALNTITQKFDVTGKTDTVTHGTTTTTTTYNAFGIISGRSIVTAAGNDATTDDFTVTATDNYGRPKITSHFGGTYSTTVAYSCCGIVKETDRQGVPTYHAYDGLRRLIKTNTLGVTTQTTYNGLITETRRYPETVNNELSSGLDTSPGTLIARTTRNNLAGTSTTSEAPNPSALLRGVGVPGALTSTLSETAYSNGLTITTTTVGTAVQITTSYPDGRTYKSVGALGPDTIHAYTVNGDGLLTSSAYLLGDTGEEPVTAETTTTQSDWAGRTTDTAKGTITAHFTYFNNSADIGWRGNLKSVTDADSVVTLYAYNSLGERTTTAISLSGADVIDYSVDQITVTESAPGSYDGKSAMITTSTVYAADNSNTPSLAGVTRSTPDGTSSWTSPPGATTATSTVSIPSPDGSINWALASQGATATQSGTGDPNTRALNAARAIDGNTDGDFSNNSVTLTNEGDAVDSSWQVDFGQTRTINRVVLFNRTDSLGTRLSNFRISVLDGTGTELVGKNYFVGSGNAGVSLTWDLDTFVNARKLKVQFLGKNNDSNGFLSLAEVQALEYVPEPVTWTPIPNSINWALASQGSTATQSATYGGITGATASRAIDGNTNGDWGGNSLSCTTDAANSWWQVDFGQTRPVNRIVLFNRTDYDLETRLSNFHIAVLDAADTELAGQDFFRGAGTHAGPSFTWDLSAFVNARKVRITILGMNNDSNGFLTLAEVQAFLVCSSYQAPSQPDGIRSEITIHPDGTRSRNIYAGGRLVRTERRDSGPGGIGNLVASSSYSYDIYGRPFTVTDSRTGTTTTIYVSATCDAVASTIDPNGTVTSYSYDSRSNRLTTTHPDNSVTRNRYNSKNQLEASWGSLTYATVYSYDYAGRMLTLRTSPDGDTAGNPIDSGGAVTRWRYDDTTGLLYGKFYDYREAGHPRGVNLTYGPTYTYTPAGRLQKRTWKRGVVTSYYYDFGGQLRAVDYSDATPDMLYTRDRLGRTKTAAQGTLAVATGTLPVDSGGITLTRLRGATYTYDPADFHLATEAVDYGGNFTKTLSRYLDTQGRPLSLAINSDYATAYAFDTAGRLEHVWDHPTLGADHGPAGNATFTYNYQENTNGLVKTLTKEPLDGSPLIQATNTWDPTRNVLATKTNTVGGAPPPSSFAYTVDDVGNRRTMGPVTSQGGPVSTYTPQWRWDYNDRGELTNAEDMTAAGKSRFYKFDDIGNRIISRTGTASDSGGTPTEYYATNSATTTGANALNQYGEIAFATGSVAPAFDEDGNMTLGPVLPRGASTPVPCTLVWDAENRLIEVWNAAHTTAIATYTYDHLSRRIRKTTTAAAPQFASDTTYIYDGWNIIAEYAGATLKTTYLWGMDLSGTMQGAGGVGGLLAVTDELEDGHPTYYPTFDGNGNVSEYLMIVGIKVIVVAHFEYDAFGNTVATLTDTRGFDTNMNFAHRFSSKYFDPETGFYYYGYRYYDPLTGRWPSRDPIEEEGGLNLYVFVGNDGILGFDFLGTDVYVFYRNNAGPTPDIDDSGKFVDYANDIQLWCKDAKDTKVISEGFDKKAELLRKIMAIKAKADAIVILDHGGVLDAFDGEEEPWKKPDAISVQFVGRLAGGGGLDHLTNANIETILSKVKVKLILTGCHCASAIITRTFLDEISKKYAVQIMANREITRYTPSINPETKKKEFRLDLSQMTTFPIN